MNEKHYAQMYAALSRIKSYQSPHRLKTKSRDDWGLDDGNEALEYAYENVLQEAKIGLRGVRKPKPASLPVQDTPGEGAPDRTRETTR